MQLYQLFISSYIIDYICKYAIMSVSTHETQAQISYHLLRLLYTFVIQVNIRKIVNTQIYKLHTGGVDS